MGGLERPRVRRGRGADRPRLCVEAGCLVLHAGGAGQPETHVYSRSPDYITCVMVVEARHGRGVAGVRGEHVCWERTGASRLLTWLCGGVAGGCVAFLGVAWGCSGGTCSVLWVCSVGSTAGRSRGSTHTGAGTACGSSLLKSTLRRHSASNCACGPCSRVICRFVLVVLRCGLCSGST